MAAVKACKVEDRCRTRRLSNRHGTWKSSHKELMKGPDNCKLWRRTLNSMSAYNIHLCKHREPSCCRLRTTFLLAQLPQSLLAHCGVFEAHMSLEDRPSMHSNMSSSTTCTCCKNSARESCSGTCSANPFRTTIVTGSLCLKLRTVTATWLPHASGLFPQKTRVDCTPLTAEDSHDIDIVLCRKQRRWQPRQSWLALIFRHKHGIRLTGGLGVQALSMDQTIKTTVNMSSKPPDLKQCCRRVQRMSAMQASVAQCSCEPKRRTP